MKGVVEPGARGSLVRDSLLGSRAEDLFALLVRASPSLRHRLPRRHAFELGLHRVGRRRHLRARARPVPTPLHRHRRHRARRATPVVVPARGTRVLSGPSVLSGPRVLSGPSVLDPARVRGAHQPPHRRLGPGALRPRRRRGPRPAKPFPLHPPQVLLHQLALQHGRDVGTAAVVPLQAPGDHLGEPGVVPLLGYRRTRAVDDLIHEAQQGIRREGVAQRGDLVRDAAERPHVALERVRLVGAHLGGEIVGRARHRGGKVIGPLQHPADAKVPELDHPAAAEEDVLGLQVAVHHAHAVDVVQRQGDLSHPVQHLPLREIPARGFRSRDVREQVAVLREGGDDAEGFIVVVQE